MATLYAYSFNKRRNSTAAPTGTGTAYTVNLKGGCDLLAPVFVLEYSGVPSFNYCFFEGRYYFVTGVKSVRDNLWEVSCDVDVLATYKTSIQASHPYVLYYTHNNTEIADKRLSTKTAITIDSSTETFNHLGGGQSYMLTAIGKSRTTIFGCSKSELDGLFDNTLLNDIQHGWNDMCDDAKDIIDAVSSGDVYDALKGIAYAALLYLKTGSQVESDILFTEDAQKFAKNCFVLPISPDELGGSMDDVYLGKWKSSAEGYKGFPRILHDSATLSIPWQASDWRRNEPYHEIYLYIPYIGLITLSASELIGVTNLTINVAVDTYSGVTSFVVNADNGEVVGQYSTNIASPYAIGSSNINLTASGAAIVSGAAAITAGFVTGGAGMVGAVAGGLVGGGLGLLNSIHPFDASISSNGGAAGMGLGNTVKCFTVYHDTTVSPSSVSAEKGTPYNGVMSLSGVSGYVQTSGASVAGSMTDTERQQINQMLDGGIYIE